jgi:hypothetical protein
MWWSRKEVPEGIQANLESAPFDGREGRNSLCRCEEAKELVDKGSAMVRRLTMCHSRSRSWRCVPTTAAKPTSKDVIHVTTTSVVR